MRVRSLIRVVKRLESDTGWRHDDLQPRYAPYFVRTMPIRKHWKWRSLAARDKVGREFVLTVRCNPEKGDWKSVLSVKTDQGGSVVGRFEFHADHPGLHIHAECGRSGIEIGPTGLDNLVRFPSGGAFHRRKTFFTDAGFLEASKKFFRIEEKKGPLL